VTQVTVVGTPADRSAAIAAYTNLSKATSFAMKVNVEGATQTLPIAGEIIMEIVQTPVRSVRLKMGEQMEMITIGQDVYLKVGTQWQKTTQPQAQFQQLQDSLDFSKTLEKAGDLQSLTVVKVGSEKVDGVDTDVYTVSGGGTSQFESVKVWIAKDGYPRKQVIEQAGSKITIVFYDWNSITIEPPKM